jgi:hypothetical protein
MYGHLCKPTQVGIGFAEAGLGENKTEVNAMKMARSFLTAQLLSEASEEVAVLRLLAV